MNEWMNKKKRKKELGKQWKEKNYKEGKRKKNKRSQRKRIINLERKMKVIIKKKQ